MKILFTSSLLVIPLLTQAEPRCKGHLNTLEINIPNELPVSSSRKWVYIHWSRDFGNSCYELLLGGFGGFDYNWVNRTVTTIPTDSFDFDRRQYSAMGQPTNYKLDGVKWQISALDFDEKSSRITSLALVVDNHGNV
jgi:hypothetical protein